MKNYFSKCCKYFVFVMFPLMAQGESVETSELVRLPGHLPEKALSNASAIEKLDADKELSLTFIFPLRNQQELETLIQHIHEQYDPAHFGKYITSEEFIERFAPTQEDYNKVITYAQELGFTIKDTHANRTLLHVSGTAKSIETAFNVNLYKFLSSTGQRFYAPDNNPLLPSSIASVISGLLGLDNVTVAHANFLKKESAGSNEGFTPKEITRAYNLSEVSRDGSGQIIALFELSGYQANDIYKYAEFFGLPTPNLMNIFVNNVRDTQPHAQSTLDIELAFALAPKSQIYVYEGPNNDQGILATYNRIATDNIAKQVSTSWSLNESLVSSRMLQAENAIFQQMAVQGQTIYAAGGDLTIFDDVNDPASQPYIVSVSGTTLTVNPINGEYQSEEAWNIGGRGAGGVSNIWPIPSWQKNVPNIASPTHRNLPDVALNANPNTGYAIYYEGKWEVIGGTGCTAPLWAAFTALINQKLVALQKPALGFANPALYEIGMGPSYTTDFHDVSLGYNIYYNAVKGYDNASGWGSFNADNLLSSLVQVVPKHPVLKRPPSPPQPPQPPAPKLSPELHISITPQSSFIRKKEGAYSVQVHNTGKGETSSPVSVKVDLPTGLRYKAFNGLGWMFDIQTNTFINYRTLGPNAHYPTLTVYAQVGPNTPNTVTTTVSVSGGGSTSETSSTTTTIK